MPYVKNVKLSRRSWLAKRPLLVAVVVVALVGVGWLAYAQVKSDPLSPTPTIDSNETPSSTEDINLDPPTEEEKKETEDNKQNLNDTPPPPPPTSNGQTEVTPVITSVENGLVRAYVPGIIEEGGTCTATATKTGMPMQTKSTTGFTDAHYTGCPPIQLTLAGSGWSVVVSYTSDSAKGQSTPWPY